MMSRKVGLSLSVMLKQKWLVLFILLLGLVGCAQNDTVEKTRKAMALHEQADKLYQAKDCMAAIDAYQDIIRQYPEGPETWFRLGNCHARLKQNPAAIAAYQETLRLEPQYGKAWHNLLYIESQGLAATMAQMYGNVPPSDPVVERVQVMIEKMLASVRGQDVSRVKASQAKVARPVNAASLVAEP